MKSLSRYKNSITVTAKSKTQIISYLPLTVNKNYKSFCKYNVLYQHSLWQGALYYFLFVVPYLDMFVKGVGVLTSLARASSFHSSVIPFIINHFFSYKKMGSGTHLKSASDRDFFSTFFNECESMASFFKSNKDAILQIHSTIIYIKLSNELNVEVNLSLHFNRT